MILELPKSHVRTLDDLLGGCIRDIHRITLKDATAGSKLNALSLIETAVQHCQQHVFRQYLDDIADVEVELKESQHGN